VELKKVQLDQEAELTYLLSSNLNAIEEGMQFIAYEVLSHDQRWRSWFDAHLIYIITIFLIGGHNSSYIVVFEI
jgi:hypothetical protein